MFVGMYWAMFVPTGKRDREKHQVIDRLLTPDHIALWQSRMSGIQAQNSVTAPCWSIGIPLAIELFDNFDSLFSGYAKL